MNIVPLLSRRSLSRLQRFAVFALLLMSSFALAAGQVRMMPSYRIRGDIIDAKDEIKRERKSFEAAYEHYRLSAKEYRDEVREFINGEISERQKTINAGYKGQIDALEQQQFDLRREAIARLELFISRHRDHDVYTPDTLFRLAEMYYEDTIAASNRSMDNYKAELDLYNRGKLLDPPKETDRDFSRSIAIYKYLHWVPDGTKMEPLSGTLSGLILDKRWPNYRLADAAMYLQGYCEGEGDKVAESIKTLSAIEAHYPNSTYIAEAWLRVGEMHFDGNEFDEAANAYEHAAARAKATGDDKNYSLALYKLGWSNFQLYKYPEAVKYFQLLIEFEDSIADKKKDTKNVTDLRKEAIEYLAKSLAEPSWDEDGCDDFGSEDTKTTCLNLDPRLRPRLYVSSVLEPEYKDFPDWKKGIGGDPLTHLNANYNAREAVRKGLMNGKPYTLDILIMYGNTLFEQAQDDYYRQAVLVLGYVVEHNPMIREAQKLQRNIIKSVDILAAAAIGYQAQLLKNPKNPSALLGLSMALSDQDRQVVERRKYLQLFAKGTPWYDKWGTDKDLAAQVDDTIGKVRLDFAQLIYVQAQTLKAAGKKEESTAKYAEAAKEFELILADLLKDQPESPRTYDTAWTLAEIYFFAGQACDGLREKGDGTTLGDLLQDKKTGELIPWPVAIVPQIKASCDMMKRSVQYYELIRDWKGQKPRDENGKVTDRTEEAGFSAIQASSYVLNARAAYQPDDPEHLSALQVPDVRPTKKQDDDDVALVEKSDKPVRVVPKPVDPATVAWLIAVDGYIKALVAANTKITDDEFRLPKLALQAAELLYKNRQFEPNKNAITPKTTADFWSARKRFRALINAWTKSSQANEAFADLLLSYKIENDFEQMQETADWGLEKGIGSKAEGELIRSIIKDQLLGGIAKKAENEFNAAQKLVLDAEASGNPEQAGKQLREARVMYEAAGDSFFDLRKQINEKDKNYAPRQKAALMNAARSYYRGEKWDRCVETLKEAEDRIRGAKIEAKEPKAIEAEKQQNIAFLDEIITMRADLNFKFFKIPEAIEDYRTLYTNNPNGPRAAKYLKSAADLAFYNSNWDLAVDLDKQIIARFEKDKDPGSAGIVAKAAARIPDSWAKKGDVPKQIDAIESFITRYTGDKLQSRAVFKAYTSISDIYESRGDVKSADKVYSRIIDAFKKGGFEKNGGAEATAAAQATFQLMKPRYDDFMKTKLATNMKLPKDKRMGDIQKQVRAMLDVVLGPEKIVESPDGKKQTVRDNSKGMYDEYANEVGVYQSQNWSYAAYLYRAKMLQYLARTIYQAPRPDDLTEDQQQQLEDFLEAFGKQIEDRAIKSLTIALGDAESKGVVNQWVNELRKAINQYKPKDYPLLKDEKRLVTDPVGTLPQPDKDLR